MHLPEINNMWCMHILKWLHVLKREHAVTLDTSQNISSHWWLSPWSIVQNEGEKHKNSDEQDMGRVRRDEIILKPQSWHASHSRICYRKSLSNKTRSAWWHQISGTNHLVSDKYTSAETINVHTGLAVCLAPFIWHPLIWLSLSSPSSFDSS